MAITTGMEIDCTDLQAAGGIRNILIRSWATGDAILYTNTSSVHGISSIVDTGGTQAIWKNFEFKNELPSLSVTASRENGSTAYECSLSFMMPEMDTKKGVVLQEMMDTCMMVIAIGNNGKAYVLGVSQKYSNEKVSTRNQTFGSMTGAEGASGAAYNDDNGWTVTLGCKQWEAIRVYSGTIVLYSGTTTSTTT